MKKLLASGIALSGLLVTAHGQTIAPVRQSAIGISYTLTDFITAQRIRSTSLTSVLNDKAVAKVSEMAAGLAISYYKGLKPKIDLAVTFNGTFVEVPFPDKPATGTVLFRWKLSSLDIFATTVAARVTGDEVVIEREDADPVRVGFDRQSAVSVR